MKTKFILHGGMTSQDNSHNNSFFTEFSKDLKDGDRVLLVGFARESDREQEEVYQRDKKTILLHTNKNLILEKAELALFKTQLENADAVYITGGTTKILKERLETCPSFRDLLNGKTYAGSSAGANVVSTYHTSGFAEGVQEGLGILPIRTMAHYGNPEFNAAKENVSWLEQYSQDLELVLLPECEWKVIEIDLL
jgi:peptidase E